MMNKELYEAPEMEILEFEGVDVITTSGYCTDYKKSQLEGYPTCATGYTWYLDGGGCANRWAYDSGEYCPPGTNVMASS